MPWFECCGGSGGGGGSSTHTYSTTEQVVGTWINGSDVYEKVFDLGSSLTVGSQSWVSTGISNLDKQVIIGCIGLSGDSSNRGTMWHLNADANTGSANEIKVWNTRNTNIAIRYIILQYTHPSSS